MSTIVAIVKSLVGQVFAVSLDGLKRQVFEGERLLMGEQILTGLGGEVMSRIGATPVNLPGAEIFSSLQSGAIDAAEWVGPYNDLAFGLHRAAKYCYYPGWQEPGPTLECMVNKAAFEALPDDLKAILEVGTREFARDMVQRLVLEDEKVAREAASQAA